MKWLYCKYAYVVSIGFLHDDKISEVIKLLGHMIKEYPAADLVGGGVHDHSHLQLLTWRA